MAHLTLLIMVVICRSCLTGTVGRMWLRGGMYAHALDECGDEGDDDQGPDAEDGCQHRAHHTRAHREGQARPAPTYRGQEHTAAHPFQYGHGAPQALSPAACATHSMMKAFMRTSTLMMI